jgi:hypothetical protein
MAGFRGFRRSRGCGMRGEGAFGGACVRGRVRGYSRGGDGAFFHRVW